jgi:hypothetical protein
MSATKWASPLTEARPPARPRSRVDGQLPGWLILAVLAWLVLILTLAYLWSVI